jgi:hypothetical protein
LALLIGYDPQPGGEDGDAVGVTGVPAGGLRHAPPPYNPRGYGMGYQQPAYQVPAFGPGRPVTTNCTKFGAGVNCSSY